MSDPLTWSIPLGRWAGSRVRIHAFLLIFLASRLLGAAWDKQSPGLAVATTAGWLLLLLVALSAKLAVQMAVGDRLGLDAEEVRVWPLGDLGRAGLTASERSGEGVMAAASGLMLNLAMALSMFVAVRMSARGWCSTRSGTPSGAAPRSGSTARPSPPSARSGGSASSGSSTGCSSSPT